MTDDRRYDAVARALLDSGEFDTVALGFNPPVPGSAGQDFPRAWLRPRKWSERSMGDPEIRQRTLMFDVRIDVQTSPDDDPQTELDRLSRVVSNAVRGQPLADCLPGLSDVTEGRYLESPADNPVSAVVLSCQLVYLIDGFTESDA